MLVKGSRYLGGFIRESGVQYTWLSEKLRVWHVKVQMLVGLVHQHMQADNADLHKSLQQ